jgi:hypothetical protein
MLPSGVSSLKTVLSNSGTIAPRLKVPRSPPLAALGHVENSWAAHRGAVHQVMMHRMMRCYAVPRVQGGE